MGIVVYHHPYSRASNVVWMLEELELPYELRFVDIMKGAQKEPAILALNRMGKLPILTDGDAVVTELAAIGVYLADRYAPGKLAPALDDPSRATFLRWSFYAPSVVEPGTSAKASGWQFRPGAAGWGTFEEMIATMEGAIAGKDYLLGDRFSMADVIFGGTIRYMLRFKMLEATPAFSAYSERLGARPAAQRAEAKNTAIAKEHGLG
ncbi:MAG TPA: glutathione S-transferase N-terminal domain-containing protein [Polyangiaceae bacterium]|jgi:glutathione S-transferase